MWQRGADGRAGMGWEGGGRVSGKWNIMGWGGGGESNLEVG